MKYPSGFLDIDGKFYPVLSHDQFELLAKLIFKNNNYDFRPGDFIMTFTQYLLNRQRFIQVKEENTYHLGYHKSYPLRQWETIKNHFKKNCPNQPYLYLKREPIDPEYAWHIITHKIKVKDIDKIYYPDVQKMRIRTQYKNQQNTHEYSK